MINTRQNLLFIATILALCVISFVHVFLFPLYDVSSRPANLKTFYELEQSLCLINLNRRIRRSQLRCPSNGIVTSFQGGRLGNQMWEYASVWGIARRTGLEPYMPRCVLWNLKNVFELLSISDFEEIGPCVVDASSFVHTLDAWNVTSQSIILRKYYTQPDIVLNWVQDITQEFTFRKGLVRKSQKILLAIGGGNNKPSTTTTTVYVGVHVRRTDYIRYLWSKYGAKPAGPEFYLNAMKYFENRFENCVFVVVSDDPKWCSQKFSHKSNVAMAGSNPASLDLAILAACNHSIFDYGTFGTWGAILAGGETVFFNLTKHSSRRVGQLLPHWLPMA